MKKRIFLSFADDSIAPTRARIRRQAMAMECYDRIYALGGADLEPHFRAWLADKVKPVWGYCRHYEVKETSDQRNLNLRRRIWRMSRVPRGYGYWAWKPQVILQTLATMEEGDILHYCDAGCHLVPRHCYALEDHFAIAEKARVGIVGFSHTSKTGMQHIDNASIIKGDLLDYFHYRHNEKFLRRPMTMSGMMFIRKCATSEAFVREWLKVYMDDFALVDDSPSRSPDLPGFVANLHDQSVFTILVDKYKAKVLPSARPGYKPAVEHPYIVIMRNKVDTKDVLIKRLNGVKSLINFLLRLQDRWAQLRANR